MSLFPQSISHEEINELSEKSKICRANILAMTTLASSGHPGGSMSSIDILLSLYKYANINPSNFGSGDSDAVIVSIGHISPAVYTCLAVNGFFPMQDAVSQFRLAGSIYEGHIERTVSGVEWTTGNLGQGLSGACGMAVAAKVKGSGSYVYVIMGDGEQQKGQQEEARHFAAKYKLNNLIAFVDCNGLQISGNTKSVMPQNIASEYASAGWNVFHINGHDFTEIVCAVREAQGLDMPSVIIAETIMGHGVSFMENDCKYHGSTLSEEDYKKAIAEIGYDPCMDKYKELRKSFKVNLSSHKSPEIVCADGLMERKYYAPDEKTDCRSAYGDAVKRVVESFYGTETPAIVFDCDLAGSVKTNSVEKNFPDRFFQCGISEHHAAAAAGAASVKGVIPFFSTFTMFAVDEVYNQLRMNDINGTNLKVACTHAGVDVGEDGRTHQCIDYLGLLRNLFGFEVITPADPNQTDQAILYAASHCGNVIVVMGRSKVPVITKEDGSAYYGEGSSFKYGSVDEIRSGEYPLVSYGVMLDRAIKVKDILNNDGVSIGVYNAASPVALDQEFIKKLAKKGIIFVLEDHQSSSGLCASISQIIASEGIACRVIGFGVDKYAYSGSPEQVFKLLGLDSQSVADKIKGILC